jgi:hypothetical protein
MSFTIIAFLFALSEVEGAARAQRGDFVSAQSAASTSPKVKFILSDCCKQSVEGLSPNGVGVSEARA